MATDHGQDIDLDKTDRLPILQGIAFDPDIEDDAVPMDHTTMLPSTSLVTSRPSASLSLQTEFIRPSPIDLPSLAESVRTVEERIARQNADYEALNRNFERIRDSESSAVARAGTLERDLVGIRTALEAEQTRARDSEKALAEKSSVAESARSKAEEALREAERHETEARGLRDSLAARDATIVQVLHSLSDRDTQLTALLQEHAKTASTLESRNKSGSQLETELNSVRASAAELSAQLKASSEAAAALKSNLKRTESEANAARSELNIAKIQSSSYLELLQSREWRRGFDQNMFRELDAKVGVADAGRDAFKAERDRLHNEVADLQLKIVAQKAAIEKLEAAASKHLGDFAQHSQELKQAEKMRAEMNEQLASMEADRSRLRRDLTAVEGELADARTQLGTGAARIKELTTAAEQRLAEHTARVSKLNAEYSAQMSEMQAKHTAQVTGMESTHSTLVADLQAQHSALVSDMQAQHDARLAAVESEHTGTVTEMESYAEMHEQEMVVLMAHLKEARKPLEPIEMEVKRLSEELAQKRAAHEALGEENLKLQSALERTRGALEEREFLIRRLERSESNNANVLGRIQTSMERLGSVPLAASAASGAAAAAPDRTSELVRIDGDRNISHVLGRRTRIGRAAGCELQIDSSSVSRHHALIVTGPRETIIEDLNSTNGVIVNGRKVSRAFLNDGDVVIVGEIQFRYAAKPVTRSGEAAPAELPPAE